MVNRKQICEFLDKVEKEEETAKDVYRVAKKRFPSEAKKLERIIGEEGKHAREFGRLAKKYGCK